MTDAPRFSGPSALVQRLVAPCVCAAEPGLCFVGLHFLYAMSSSMIHGVGRDAEYLAEYIAGRRGEAPAPAARRQAEAVA